MSTNKIVLKAQNSLFVLSNKDASSQWKIMVKKETFLGLKALLGCPFTSDLEPLVFEKKYVEVNHWAKNGWMS